MPEAPFRWVEGGGESRGAILAAGDIGQRTAATFAHPAGPGLEAVTIEDLHGTARIIGDFIVQELCRGIGFWATFWRK